VRDIRRMLVGLAMFLGLTVACCGAQSGSVQSGIAGDWKGTLSAGGINLRLVLHVTQAAGGSLHATLDSVDQNANGIPVSAITLNGNKLHLSVDAVHGTYDGAVNADATEIDGTWSQGTPLPLKFQRTGATPPAPNSLAEGTWQGKLNAGALALRIVFRITSTSAGWTAKMQSPDQSPAWLDASSVTVSDGTVTITVQRVGGTFTGTLSADGKTLSGNWQQGGGTFPLTLQRVTNEAERTRPRPQNPVKPYPYREEEVSFANPVAAGATVAGTLTIPPGKGQFPAVLLVAGSGPHDRDETLMGHKPFLVLSDYLTRRGIVVLRYDKRGIGQSTGGYATATTSDFGSDAEAGVAYLRKRLEVNSAEVGLIGHSEGALIAPMVAATDPKVAYIVMMAGTGVPGDRVIEEQAKLIERASGVSPDEVEKHATAEKALLTQLEAGADKATLEKTLRASMAAVGSEAQIDPQLKMLESPWFRYFLTYDPATALRRVKCPVLVLDGSKDLQVSPEQNLPAIRKAMEEGGNRHFEIMEMPGLNHLFQTAKTGIPSEYSEIEETMAPAAMDKIAGWVLEQAGDKSGLVAPDTIGLQLP
jgi:uncharacterized protein